MTLAIVAISHAGSLNIAQPWVTRVGNKNPDRGGPMSAQGGANVSAANIAQPWVTRVGNKNPDRGDPMSAQGEANVSAANIAQP